MTKLKTLSAIALLSALLTACDKVAEKVSATQAETTPVQTENVIEKVGAKTETAETGVQDYKLFRAWQKEQEQAIEKAIAAEVETLGDKAKDEKLLREAMNKALSTQAELIKQSAATLLITDEEVKLLKDKSLEALALGVQLMIESEKMAEQPTEEVHKAFNELQLKLDQIAQEGKAIEAELVKKYEITSEKAQESAK